MAVSTTPPPQATPSVEAAWHLLNTNDAARAMVDYHELFGWEIQRRVEVPPHGVFHEFAWHAGGPSVGAITDITGLPGRHPHWLFFFRVISGPCQPLSIGRACRSKHRDTPAPAPD